MREPLERWIGRLLAEPGLAAMGHNQRADAGELGLGWLYYALGRTLRPRRAVVIGSYRGFVPMVVARALADAPERGEVTFIDPGLVDDHWHDPDRVRAWFERFGLDNVVHHRATTQAFAASPAHAALPELGLVFVDGFHSAEQARLDHRAFADKLGPYGLTLFHDSMSRRRSTLYGDDRAYDTNVGDYLAELARDPAWQVLDLPYATGLSIVRRRGPAGLEPWLEGVVARPR